ncbi:PLP-dependent aminotransferase family protein [Companilactobacillus mishanensis]|uniref:aminotransferase-like domain-containing protein n=1 Tax=Companilactobacillus mishanensis TaxID=2486008 RepID=UPI0012957CB3|nr:PLP-dependent aminotransferase family protein [Companilactobacillus mishanensis]MQS89814.1 PLP-dependent aminotransferase family protein [Companilactobacillus mishanensis]
MINWSADLPNIKPKYQAIIQLIKHLIQTDQLIPGQRLPAERNLAKLLDVDRSTVTRAIAELTSQDLLVKKRGSGTFVAELPHLKPLSVNINWQALLSSTNANHDLTAEELNQARILDPQNIIDGAANELPADLIPNLGTFKLDWQAYLKDQKHASSTGYLDLINTLSRQQEIQQKIDLNRQTVMIAGGAEQSLLLVLSSLLSAGDSIAFTNPSYFNSTAVFQTLGINTYGVPLIHSQFDLKRLEEVILKHRIKLLILNPTFQNPTGETLTLNQRQQVLEICQKYQVAIVEDDVFGWLINDQSSTPTLKSLAPENVIYISSLSKLLGSSTRIGWIIAPQAIGQRLLQVQKQLDMVPSMLAQEMVNSALTSSEFSLGLIQLTKKLQARREAVAEIFHKYRPNWKFTVPDGGFYLWITQDDPDIFNKLLDEKILVKPGTVYGATKKEFRFNVARMDEKRLMELQFRLRN